MTIVDALNMLERAGQENSRVTAKLHAAAKQVAYKIEAAVPRGVKLPRGYVVQLVTLNGRSAKFLTLWQPTSPTLWIDGQDRALHGDFHDWVPGPTRQGSLQFAKDVAEGLLEEIAEFIEQRKHVAADATIVLDATEENENETT